MLRRVHVAARELRQRDRATALRPCVVRNSVALVRRHHELRPHLVRVLLDPRDRALADRHHAVLLALALPHEQRAALGVEVVDRKLHELRSAACPSSRASRGSRGRAAPIGVAHVRLRRAPPRPPPRVSTCRGSRRSSLGSSSSARGVLEQHVLARQPLEVAPAPAPAALCCDRKDSGWPSSLPLVEEVPLVALEDRLRHFLRPHELRASHHAMKKPR